MNKPMKHTRAPTLSEERQALADAIERRDAAAKTLEATKAAVQSTLNERIEADTRLDNAKSSLLQAEKNEVNARVKRHMGEEVPKSQSVADAQKQIQSVEAEVASINRARAHLAKQLETAKDFFHRMNTDFMAARDRVLASSPELQQLLEDIRVSEAVQARLRTALHAFPVGVIPINTNQSIIGRDYFDPSLRDEWKKSIEALNSRADAPLPS
jgi:chromosome segregation ATPase